LVYCSHATTPISFGILFISYYVAIPLAFLAWLTMYWRYLKRGVYKIKQLVGFMLVALLITSVSLFLMLNDYVYLHSPDRTGIVLRGSDFYSSPMLEGYGINPQQLKKFGVPSCGVMRMYRMVDSVLPQNSIVTQVNSIVIIRMIPFVPAVKIYDYKVEGNKIVHLRTFYVVWPEQPGSVLTKEYKALFTIFTNLGGRGNSGPMV